MVYLIQGTIKRRGRPATRISATKAVSVKEEIFSRDHDASTARDGADADNQRDVIGTSHSDAVASAESSQVGSNVDQVLIETTAVDYSDIVDIPSTMTIGSLENGAVYVLQPVESVAQNVGCRTLRLLTGTSDGDDHGSTAAQAVLVDASSGDVISSSADLAHFLRSAGITGVKPEPASHAESTT